MNKYSNFFFWKKIYINIYIYPHWAILPEFYRRASLCVYVNPTEVYEKVMRTSRVGRTRKGTRIKGKERARRRGRGGARGGKGGKDEEEIEKEQGERIQGI